MNSEQLRLFINGAFGNEADARKVKRLLDPYLRRSLDEIRQLIELLPDESLARQREWRAILAQIDRVLEPYNDAFAIELGRQLPVSGAAAAEETTLMLKSVVPQTAGSGASCSDHGGLNQVSAEYQGQWTQGAWLLYP